ncbi:MAG: hypothetical protein QNJ46_00580 [Leptolyngbyaceae cyanobacterium MO_188.B28]|nr:hypothetical protein [Leptolyngbyaceae cyanobacterium MO_188.B28]
MTSEKDQIQTLIAEIETFLSKPTPRLPWGKVGDADPQRQILAKTQRYLIGLQQSMQAPGGWGPIDPETGALTPSGPPTLPNQLSTESAQQVLQAFLQEMHYLRANLLQPLRLEIDALHERRQTLQQEVQQLENQSRQAGGSQSGDSRQLLNEFMDVFMERLQQSLAAQIAQALTQLRSDAANNLLLEEFLEADVAAADRPRLHPAQRLDHLRTVQSESDQLLLKLDSTLKVVFETLEKNVQSYQESLSQGLSKMHGLGSRGETIVTALITHLAQQLGRDTSAYLDASLEAGAGSELGALSGKSTVQNRLLAFQEETSPGAAEDPSPTPESWEAPLDGFDSGELDSGELDFGLDDLDLDLDIDIDDEDMGRLLGDAADPLASLDDEDGALAADADRESTHPHPPIAITDTAHPAVEPAVDILSQLSDGGQEIDAAVPNDLRDAAAQLDVSSNLKELDDFYQSLFGESDGELGAEASTPAISDPKVTDAELGLSAPLDLGEAVKEDAGSMVDGQTEALIQPDLEKSALGDLLLEASADSGLSTPPSSEQALSGPSEGSGQLGDASDPQTMIDSFFGEVDFSQQAATWEADSTPDTISALTDLLPKGKVDSARFLAQDTGEAAPEGVDSLDIELSEDLSASGWDGDAYIPAPPEEDLLAKEDPAEELGLNLDLVDSALQKLMNEELSSLEGVDLTKPSDLDQAFAADSSSDQPSESSPQPEGAGETSNQALLESIVQELDIADALSDLETEGEAGLTPQKLIETEIQQATAGPVSSSDAEDITDTEDITLEALEELILEDLAPQLDRLSALLPPVVAEDLGSSENLGLDELVEDLLDASKVDSIPADDIEARLLLSDEEDPDREIDGIEEGLSLQNVLEEAVASSQLAPSVEAVELTLESLAALTLEDLASGDESEAALEVEAGGEADDGFSPEEGMDPQLDPASEKSAPDIEPGDASLSSPSAPDMSAPPEQGAEARITSPGEESLSEWTQLESALAPDSPDSDADLESALAPDAFDGVFDDVLDIEGDLDLGAEPQSWPVHPQPPGDSIADDVTDDDELEALLEDALAEELPAADWTPREVAEPVAYRGGDALDSTREEPLETPGVKLSPEAAAWIEEALKIDGDDLGSIDAADAALTEVESEAESGLKAVENGPPVEPAEEAELQQQWFLGIDLGGTGLSAVLMDRVEGNAYPIYWVAEDPPEATGPAEKLFRLPVIAYLTQTAPAADPALSHQSLGLQLEAVGPGALRVALDDYADVPEGGGVHSMPPGLLLRSLKTLLKVGIPFYAPQQEAWEPMIQWSDSQQLPLQLVHESLRAMLHTLWPLDPPGNLDASRPALACGAIGLDAYGFKRALETLQGVIVGYPANWPDTYSFNIREALLAAQLVIHPEQIFFVEDGIAAVLSGLPDPNADLSPQPPHQQGLYNCDWQGGTIVVNGGASLTELTVVDIPDNLEGVTYGDFSCRSFPYAGDAIDQDIICQLLYPPAYRQSREAADPVAVPAADGWAWQADLPESARTDWQSLGLESMELPRPGEPGGANRHRLQKRLEDSLLGQSLLEAARHLKLILQHQPQCKLELGDQQWLIRRKDMESRIFLPYIQRVNRQLNILLSQTGFSSQAINQVICTGGSASLAAIARWLRQKFPNATIIQDTYPSDRPASCSRVAYGLVNLSRYPQVLDMVRQQYSDYFLLLELIRHFPEQPLPITGIMHLLESRGINTKVCYSHILALLEGHLPPGLIPTEPDLPWMTQQSLDNGDYQSLGSPPLFTKQGKQIYIPNLTQRQRLSDHLEGLMAGKHQTLEEPLIAQLAPVFLGRS